MTEDELANAVIHSAIPKAKKKFLGYDDTSDFARMMAKKVTKPTDEISDPTTKERVTHSLLGGATSLIMTPIISRLLKQKVSKPLLVANTIGSLVTGYLTPDIANVIRREVRGDIDKNESRQIINDYDKVIIHSEDRARELSDFYKNKIEEGSFKKESGLTDILFKGVAATPKVLFKTTFPGKGANTTRRYIGYGAKTGIAAGGIYGGVKASKKLTGPRSGSNYTTFLRNNVLSGNIKPSELSRDDMVAVRKLGMR